MVSYNSRRHLRASIEPLSRIEGVRAVVVDNASSDGTVSTISDLDVTIMALPRNRGFGTGCNIGAASGTAPHILFLNPDATIDERSLQNLVAALDADEQIGLAAPRILESDGSLAFSQRRFPRLRSTYARAFFLHRFFPRAAWTDELVRDPSAYERAASPEWVSGAAMLVRRSVFERVDGFDERFFLYCEDKDLCQRIRAAGYDVRYEPDTTVRHLGGASAPRAGLLPVLARSRIDYAEKHWSRGGALLERAGLALNALTHAVLGQGGREKRAGHLSALAVALGRYPPRRQAV